MSDYGGEFNNEEMRALGDKFGIKILTTAAQSPWSNGVCEPLNSTLAGSVNKIMHECKCNLDIALAWVVSARNSLSNFSGFSPNHLVFGYNPAVMPPVYNYRAHVRTDVHIRTHAYDTP